MHVPAKARGIITVTPFDLGQDRVVIRIQVEPFLRGKEGYVRQEKADGHKERFLGLFIELINGPISDQPVALLLVFMREGAPVDQAMIAKRCGDQFLIPLWEGLAAGPRANQIKFLVRFLPAVTTVINLPCRVRRISPVLLQILRQRDDIFKLRHIAKPRREPIDARAARSPTDHQAGPRGVAQGRLTMRIGKCRAALGQAIDVWRLHHRMPAEIADPIVLVIDRDE